MSHKTLINGTGYELKGGKTLVNGTGYSVKQGKTLVNGAGYDIGFNISISNLGIGSIVKINENGTPVNYIIVHRGIPDTSIYDSTSDGVWVLREDIRNFDAWASTSNCKGYPYSTLSTTLNTTIYNMYDSNIQSCIKQVNIPCRYIYESGPGRYGRVANFARKVFALSCYELGWYTNDWQSPCADGAILSYFANGGSRDPSSGNSWGLRTIGFSDGDIWRPYFYGERDNNRSYTDSLTNYCDARPAMVLDYNTIVTSDGLVVGL